MDGVDLSQFQFDYDLTWMALFLNADGTVYARYGSRNVDDPMATNSPEGLVAAMGRVLEAHAGYPANRRLFEAKRGPAPRFKRPEDIAAALAASRRGASRGRREGCFHCHDVQEMLHEVEIGAGGVPAEVYKYPFPENIGLAVDAAAGTRIERVLPDSPASSAGIRPGDEIVSMNGQATLTLADIQFVLHHLPREAKLEVSLRRGDGDARRVESAALRLSGPWRANDFTWRTSLKSFPPDAGLHVRTLEEGEKEALGIARDRVALEVAGLFGPAVKRSGLEEGDVIVGYDGKTDAIGAVRFKDHIRLHHFLPGSVLRLEVRRGAALRAIEVRF